MTENELYHHGILGMRWGVRRYQNYDGTLTEAGKNRYLDVSFDPKLQKRDTRDALYLTKKNATINQIHANSAKKKALKEEKKVAKAAVKYEQASNKGDSDKANKYQEKANKHFVKALENTQKGEDFVAKSDLYKQKYDSISNGTMKAGKDFIVQRDYNAYPLVIPYGGSLIVGVGVNKEMRLIENKK